MKEQEIHHLPSITSQAILESVNKKVTFALALVSILTKMQQDARDAFDVCFLFYL